MLQLRSVCAGFTRMRALLLVHVCASHGTMAISFATSHLHCFTNTVEHRWWCCSTQWTPVCSLAASLASLSSASRSTPRIHFHGCVQHDIYLVLHNISIVKQADKQNVLTPQMIKEKAQLGSIASGLADLNEMRLSKFEYALLTAKMMEVIFSLAHFILPPRSVYLCFSLFCITHTLSLVPSASLPRSRCHSLLNII